MFVIGKKSMEEGMNILGAHIDSPRMDLKTGPVMRYRFCNVRYPLWRYQKYQWVTLPLALHGVIVKKTGTVVKVNVGDKPGDPVFGVSDLLIHHQESSLKKAAKVIEGREP